LTLLSRLRERRDRIRRLEAELAQYQHGWPPGHFYSPIPSRDELVRRQDQLFGPSPAALPGIELNEAGQLELLGELGRLSAAHPWSDEPTEGTRYHFENPNFRHGEALALLGMLRLAKPARVLEVGSGYSSAAILDIADRLPRRPECVFVDPYPELLERLLVPGDRVEILSQPVQDIGFEHFLRLEAQDVLFIDSTHVAKTGSDVNRLYHEVLPRLAPGVLVHVHDIYYPFEYPREWVLEGRSWNEAYLLRALLCCTAAFEIRLFTSYLAQHHRAALEAALPLSSRGAGSSLWLSVR
jgi:predicted O-methyltransferase YrrM